MVRGVRLPVTVLAVVVIVVVVIMVIVMMPVVVVIIVVIVMMVIVVMVVIMMMMVIPVDIADDRPGGCCPQTITQPFYQAAGKLLPGGRAGWRNGNDRRDGCGIEKCRSIMLWGRHRDS